MVFYLVISIILYIFVKEFGLWAALSITVISYPHMVLFLATILRMRGDITERSFINLVLEGLKIIKLLQKTQTGLTNIKLNISSNKFKKS